MTTTQAAVITGASSGIGAATAQLFAADGMDVCLAARTASTLEELAQSLEARHGIRAIPVAGDLGDKGAIDRLFDTCEREFGRLDVLVNAGADVPSRAPLSASESEWEEGIATKLLGYVRCSRRAADLMRRSGGGAIIHVVSISGREPMAASGVPGATNAALLNVTKTMAIELAAHGIRVNTVNPGYTATARMERHTEAMAEELGISQNELKRRLLDSIPLQRFGTAEDMAQAIRFLASPHASYITGTSLNVDGGVTKAAL